MFARNYYIVVKTPHLRKLIYPPTKYPCKERFFRIEHDFCSTRVSISPKPTHLPDVEFHRRFKTSLPGNPAANSRTTNTKPAPYASQLNTSLHGQPRDSWGLQYCITPVGLVIQREDHYQHSKTQSQSDEGWSQSAERLIHIFGTFLHRALLDHFYNTISIYGTTTDLKLHLQKHAAVFFLS